MSVKDLEEKIDRLRAEAAGVQGDLRARRAAIDADESLSLQGKTAAKDAATAAAKADLVKLRDREKQMVADRIDQINRTLGGFTAGADPSAIIAFRDAYDRAEAIAERDVAMQILERARTVGDKVLAAAIMRRALDQGWRAVYDRYVEAYPTSKADVDDLRTLEEFLKDGFSRTLTYAVIG
jgi:hypothetical protein